MVNFGIVGFGLHAVKRLMPNGEPDTCYSEGSRRNRCVGGGGPDICITGDQNSDCVGGPGDDLCVHGSGSDGCWGGPGDDVCRMDHGVRGRIQDLTVPPNTLYKYALIRNQRLRFLHRLSDGRSAFVDAEGP